MSRPGPETQRGTSPAALLEAERSVVPFLGRGRELAELQAWSRSRESLERPRGRLRIPCTARTGGQW